MRIRQIKPDYWSDPVTARLSDSAQLLYIGLWCVADDAGYLAWDTETIGAHLRPYESPGRRVKRIEQAAGELVAAGRLVRLACGHAVIPTLPIHQRLSGAAKRVHTERGKHDARQCPHIPADARTSPHIPDTEKGTGNRERNMERNMERNGTEQVTAGARAQESRDPRTIPLRLEDGQWVHVT